VARNWKEWLHIALNSRENPQDPQSVPPYSTLFCVGREERCNLFCRTFLLHCQEMPVGFSPLDKIRVE